MLGNEHQCKEKLEMAISKGGTGHYWVSSSWTVGTGSEQLLNCGHWQWAALELWALAVSSSWTVGTGSEQLLSCGHWQWAALELWALAVSSSWAVDTGSKQPLNCDLFVHRVLQLMNLTDSRLGQGGCEKLDPLPAEFLWAVPQDLRRGSGPENIKGPYHFAH